jgi:hypothetical protein
MFNNILYIYMEACKHLFRPMYKGKLLDEAGDLSTSRHATGRPFFLNYSPLASRFAFSALNLTFAAARRWRSHSRLASASASFLALVASSQAVVSLTRSVSSQALSLSGLKTASSQSVEAAQPGTRCVRPIAVSWASRALAYFSRRIVRFARPEDDLG